MNHSDRLLLRLVGKKVTMLKRTIQFCNLGTSTHRRQYYYSSHSTRNSFQLSSNFMDQENKRHYNNDTIDNLNNKQKGEENSHIQQRQRQHTKYQKFFSTSTTSSKSTTNEKATVTTFRDRWGGGKSKYEEESSSKEKVRTKQTSYQMLKQYGPVFIGTYTTLSITTLGGFYGSISSGIIDPVTIMGYLTTTTDDGSISGQTTTTTSQVIIDYLNTNYSWSQTTVVPFLESNPYFANLAIAWVAMQMTEPARILVCFAVVPKLAKYLGFVAVPTKEK